MKSGQQKVQYPNAYRHIADNKSWKKDFNHFNHNWNEAK